MSKKPPTLVQFNYSEPSKTLEEQMSETAEPCDATNGGQEEIMEDPIDTLVESVASVEVEDDDLLEEIVEDPKDGPKEEPIKVVGKPDIDEKAIFSNFPDNLAVVPDNLKKVISEKPIKPKKARKPMTEEHKAKLALAREKAMASRKAKAEERKKMKELEKQEKELVKQQKVKRVQKLKEEVDSLDRRSSNQRDAEGPSDIKETVQQKAGASGLTRKDLEEAQLDAIMKYEAMRKERKAKKKQEQAIEAEKQKMLNTIQRATGTYGYRGRDANGRLLNRFDSCY